MYIYISYICIYIYIYIYHGRNSKCKCLVKLVKHIYYQSKNATNEKSTQKRQLLAQSQQWYMFQQHYKFDKTSTLPTLKKQFFSG